MRANKRFIFTLGTIGIWTLLTYFIVIRIHSDHQNGKSKFREKIQNLEEKMKEEAESRKQIIRQYNSLIQEVRSKTTASPTLPVVQESNVAPLEDDKAEVPLNNKIDFNGKYISDDVNFPVIPVIVFACNRVSISRNLDALIKYRPSREQFPIIVSQVNYRKYFAYSVQLIIQPSIIVGLRRWSYAWSHHVL